GAEQRPRERPQHPFARLGVVERRQVLLVNPRRELRSFRVRVRREHAEREVRITIEQAADGATGHSSLAGHLRIVAEAPHPRVQQHEAPHHAGLTYGEWKPDRAAEVVYDERDVAQRQALDEGPQQRGGRLGAVGEYTWPIRQTHPP